MPRYLPVKTLPDTYYTFADVNAELLTAELQNQIAAHYVLQNVSGNIAAEVPSGMTIDESAVDAVFSQHNPVAQTGSQILQGKVDAADVAANDFDYDAFTRKAILKAIAKHERLLLYQPLAEKINELIGILKLLPTGGAFNLVDDVAIATLGQLKTAVDTELDLIE